VTAADPKSWSSIIGTPAGDGGAAAEYVPVADPDAPRRLMTGVRAVMAALDSPERKLSRIVELAARELKADTCVCYILRAGGVLDLFASSGPVPGPGRARLGEGCAGDIAATGVSVVLSDITVHSHYAGESSYKAFCGVPVLRGGRVRGVLALQNKFHRAFGEDIVDALQTVAMATAELIAAGGLSARPEPGAAGRPGRIEAVALSKGIAVGTAVLYEAGVDMQDVAAEDPAQQKQRLHRALGSMHEAIDKMISGNLVPSGTESRDILEAYQMFARDRGWLTRIEGVIDRGLSAEAAVQRVQNETRARMLQMSDAYIRERLHDLEDLSNRLLNHLVRQDRAAAQPEPPGDMILVARSLGPAALLDYDHGKLKGVVLEKGSHTNHVAIVARALGIPVVGQCDGIRDAIADGDRVIVDGDQGLIHVNPSDDVLDLYARSIEARARRAAVGRRERQRGCATKDGVKISVMVNAGLLADAGEGLATEAEGIGLFRTELSFMNWKKYPPVPTQAELYSRVLDEAAGRPVVFRTFDIGGDKPLPYFTPPAGEDNPAMGWRGMRIATDRPAVLRAQFRALLRAARGRDLKVMLPFVSAVPEYDAAREMLENEKARAVRDGERLPDKIELGVMIEVPALLWRLDVLLETADFVSVGTNDLLQYLYAADRGNHVVRGRYDALSPAMLRVLKHIQDACRAANKPVSVCGEMACQPLEAMALIGLGFDTLSVPAQSVETVRTLARGIDTQAMRPYLEQLMALRAHSVRENLAAFARDHDISVTSASS
jgi:phosphotransferase system enzyme I (PtsP)